MSDERDERGGIRVTDRRRFSETGEPRDEAGHATEQAAEGPGDAHDPPSDEAAAAAKSAADAAGSAAGPPVSFSTFILGLSTQALMHLGEVEHPITGHKERDLPAAKHVIDVLGVLSAKTSGNLDSAERALMESVLYDLRMRYVDLVRRAGDTKQKQKEEA
jgi:hypothetical protein